MGKKTKKTKENAVDNQEAIQKNLPPSKSKSSHIFKTLHSKNSNEKFNENHGLDTKEIHTITERFNKINDLINLIKPDGSVDSFSVHNFKQIIKSKPYKIVGLELSEKNNKYTIQLDDMILGFHPPHGGKEFIDKKFLSNLSSVLTTKSVELLEKLEKAQEHKDKQCFSDESVKKNSKSYVTSTHSTLFKKQKTYQSEELNLPTPSEHIKG